MATTDERVTIRARNSFERQVVIYFSPGLRAQRAEIFMGGEDEVETARLKAYALLMLDAVDDEQAEEVASSAYVYPAEKPEEAAVGAAQAEPQLEEQAE